MPRNNHGFNLVSARPKSGGTPDLTGRRPVPPAMTKSQDKDCDFGDSNIFRTARTKAAASAAVPMVMRR